MEPQVSGLDSEFSTGIWNFKWIKLKSLFPNLFPWWWGKGKVSTNCRFLSVSDALNHLHELQTAVDFSKTHEKLLHFPSSSLSRKVLLQFGGSSSLPYFLQLWSLCLIPQPRTRTSQMSSKDTVVFETAWDLCPGTSLLYTDTDKIHQLGCAWWESTHNDLIHNLSCSSCSLEKAFIGYCCQISYNS